MQFNDTTNKQGLCQDTRFLLGLGVNDTVSYSDADLTRNINSWYRQVDSWIWQAAGNWEYDDSNYTDLPIATTDLVDEQKDYSLPTACHKILRVEVMDSNGNYQKLTPIDQTDIQEAMTEFQETNGMPIYYDVVGRSIVLYPTPSSSDVTTTDGLKLYMSRTIDEFAATDTSTEAGFDANFHRSLSLGAALDWAYAHDMPANLITSINSQLALQRESINKFYGTRHTDYKPRIIPQLHDNI